MIWSDDDTQKLINIIESLNVMAILDGKRQRNGDIFEKVAMELNLEGKNMKECRNKFKKLKLKYKEEQIKASKSGSNLFIIYTKLMMLLL